MTRTGRPSRTQLGYQIIRRGTRRSNSGPVPRMLEEEPRPGRIFEKLGHCRVHLAARPPGGPRMAADPGPEPHPVGAGEGKVVLIVLLCVTLGSASSPRILALTVNP